MRADLNRPSALKELQARLDRLFMHARDLVETGGEFGAQRVGSTDPTVVKGTAVPRAMAGAYQVSIRGLAQAHRITSDTLSSQGASLVPGKYAFWIGVGPHSATIDLTVVQCDTHLSVLTKMADAINGARVPVTAVLLGAGSDSIRLEITSHQTGLRGAISIVNLKGNLMTALHMKPTSQAAGKRGGSLTLPADALVEIDGVAFERPSNRIELHDVGLVLSLLGEGTAIVEVRVDAGGLCQAVARLVACHNPAITEAETVSPRASVGSRFRALAPAWRR